MLILINTVLDMTQIHNFGCVMVNGVKMWVFLELIVVFLFIMIT